MAEGLAAFEQRVLVQKIADGLTAFKRRILAELFQQSQARGYSGPKASEAKLGEDDDLEQSVVGRDGIASVLGSF